ncbi:hypothetical protein BDZ89DRAFT_1065124 [Hymenopellis radicata]|nr:hypothetical protein BDZ89DRAFT_1065124 [Hymenopellis radicata]
MSGAFFISLFPILLPLMAKRSLSPAGTASDSAEEEIIPHPALLSLIRPRPPITPPVVAPAAACQSTPRNNGAASQLDHDEHHTRADVDAYVDEDLQTHRIYLPTDVFLNVLLGVPDDLDSNDEFQAIIKAILVDPAYVTARAKFSSVCRLEKIQHENILYPGYVEMCNAAASVIATKDCRPSDLALWCRRQDPKRVLGSLAKLSPDAFSIYKKLCDGLRVDNANPDLLAWAHDQLWHDLKRFIKILDNGSTAPYVVLDKDGRDPRNLDMLLKAFAKYEERTGAPPVYSTELKATKRQIQSYADDLSTRPAKRSRTRVKLPGSDGNAPTLQAPTLHPQDDAIERHGASRHCARYALETLSSGGFRSHSFGILVGRNVMQVLYYDRSVIAVCEPFQMFDAQLQSSSSRDKDEHRFLALLICSQRASLAQRGIMDSLMPDPFLEVYSAYKEAVKPEPSFLFDKREIQLLVNNKTVIVTLGRIIMRQPGIIGRNTCVLEAKSDEWPGRELIIKISWPASSRVAENVFVDRIREAVTDGGEAAAWVLDHIPNVLHSQDFPLSADSPGTRLSEYLESSASFVADKSFSYETRVCRVSVHERLYSLDDLRKPSEYAQVFFDVLQVHRWIYDYPRILHRDLSVGNIMWHRRRGRICGVLNDFDLSSFRDSTGASSKQRTGTRPFLAHELHLPDSNGQPVIHLYRHDLESLFYIMVLLFCSHEMPTTDSPSLRVVKNSQYHSWFSMTDERLSEKKHKMLSSKYNDGLVPVPHHSFGAFGDWLKGLYVQLHTGVRFRTNAEVDSYDADVMDDEDQEQDSAPIAEEPQSQSFDDSTLGGAVSYAAFFQIMREFGKSRSAPRVKGKLAVMYPPKED